MAVILLAVVVVGLWFSDSIGFLLQRRPEASLLLGTWVAEKPQGQRGGSPTVITFAPGTITMDTGDGRALPIPCTIEGYPPNAYLVTMGEGPSFREIVFQLNITTGAKRLSMSVGHWQVPFTRKE